MRRVRDMNEWIIERFLGRTAPADNDSLDDISWFVGDMQSAYPEATVDEATASGHVSAMLAAHLSAENGDPAVKSVSKAHGPAPQVSGLPKLRRKLVLSNLLGSLAAKIATGAVAAFTAFSGMAVAGVLPDPAQSVAATLASYVGIDIDDPDEQGVEDPAEQDIGTLDDEDAAKLDEDEVEEEVEDEGDDDLDGNDTGLTDDANDTVGGTGGDTADTVDTADTADTADTVSEDTASAPSAPSADTAEEEDTGDASAEAEQNETEDDNDNDNDTADDDADSADEPDSEDD